MQRNLNCVLYENKKCSNAAYVSELKEDVFEGCTSTGSGLFSFLSSIFPQMFGQIVSVIRKILRNTNLPASIYI